jgi:hypothetical protein
LRQQAADEARGEGQGNAFNGAIAAAMSRAAARCLGFSTSKVSLETQNLIKSVTFFMLII